jgi:hypothetical protein
MHPDTLKMHGNSVVTSDEITGFGRRDAFRAEIYGNDEDIRKTICACGQRQSQIMGLPSTKHPSAKLEGPPRFKVDANSATVK